MFTGIPTELFPEIEPYDSGHIAVFGGHRIYYEQCGNKKGLPILFVHGGPGAGCGTDDRRFFDPDKWRIILFDQRGCGRSEPQGRLEANNTWALVDDMHTLLRRLEIERTVLFCGSWGSTLSTVFAIEYPRRVSGLILRGIFLGTQKEIDYSYKDGYQGAGIMSPDSWERYICNVPLEYRGDPLAYYKDKIAKGSSYMARELARYECANLHLIPPTEEELSEDIASAPEIALLEAHYLTRKCFLEDNYILDRAPDIPRSTPVTIVHGLYDLVCMPLSAQRLHKAIRHSKIRMTVAGHSSRDPETLRVLIEETDKMFDLVRSQSA